MATAVLVLWRRLALTSLHVALLLMSLMSHEVEAVGLDVLNEDLLLPLCNPNTYPNTTRWQPLPPYTANLFQLQNILMSSASSRLFDIQNVSGGNTTVYGTFQCRGDLNSTQCASCIVDAVASADTWCRQSVAARIELNLCSFMYQNFPIEANLTIISSIVSETDNNSAVFLASRLAVLNNVSAIAVSSPHFYSSAAKNSVYAIAQCHGYLTPSECAECIGSAAQSSDDLFMNNTGGRAFYGSCMVEYESYPFSGPPAEVEGAPSQDPFSHSLHKSSNTVLIAAVIVLGCVILSLICFNSFLLRKLASSAYKKRGKGDDLEESLQQHQIRPFSSKLLKEATKNFDLRNKIGEGGFGSVYRGMLPDGQDIAVKKLSILSGRHKNDSFMAEVKAMTKVQHRNLIRLLGWCLDLSEKYLIYEFLPKGSLDKHIFGKEGEHLPWNIRQKIILGAAKGLMYLHHESNACIVHRDIKAANILLDDSMEPKIADFGLARLFVPGETHVLTTAQGTLGYLAPEQLFGGFSDKSDTYSFGMVILEILSGRKVIDNTLPTEQHILVLWAWSLYEERRAMELMDPLLEGQYAQEEVNRLIQIALLCTQMVAAKRPTMKKVVAWLEGDAEIMDIPRKPDTASRECSELFKLIFSPELVCSAANSALPGDAHDSPHNEESGLLPSVEFVKMAIERSTGRTSSDFSHS